MASNSGWWMASVGAFLMLGGSGAANLLRSPLGGAAAFEAARDSVADERRYVAAVGTIGDSAIRRLDFFPTRAQLRVQTAFISSSNGTQVPFDDLASRSDAAAQAIDAAVERLAGVTVPRDLEALNAELVKALQDATRASASLTHAAYACQLSMSSVERCQVPFSGASTRLAKAYERYLGVRGRIREKVLDTDTHMTPFSR
jgi:hypothetical protein